MDRFLHIFKSLALAPIGLDRLRPWMWSSEEESEENILFNFGQFMSVLHLEADVKLPHDSLVVIAVHYTGSHADIQVILEFLWLPHCHYTKALIIPPSTFKVKKFLSKLWTWRWSSVLKATSIEKWRWCFIQNPVYMKTRFPIRILCFVGSDIKLLRIFNALTNYFHTKSCFWESLFCF